MTLAGAVYLLICSLPLLLVLMAFIVALGKVPGMRRRRHTVFIGPERRCPYRGQHTLPDGSPCTYLPENCPLRRGPTKDDTEETQA